MEARTMIVYDLMQDHGIGKSGVPTDFTLEFSVQHLENANSNVRKYAKKILIELLNKLGDAKIKPFLALNMIVGIEKAILILLEARKFRTERSRFIIQNVPNILDL